MSLLRKISIVSMLVGAAGVGAVQNVTLRERSREVGRLERRMEQDRQTWLQLQRERDDALRRLDDARRAEIVESFAASGDESHDEKIRALLLRLKRLREWMDRRPEWRFPELEFLADAEWFEMMGERPLLDSDRDFRWVALALKRRAQEAFLPFLTGAMENFLRENGGRSPTSIAQLGPFLIHPFGDAMLDRYELVPSRLPFEKPVICERVPPGPNPPLLESVPIFSHDSEGNRTETTVRILSFIAELRAEMASAPIGSGSAALDSQYREVQDAILRYQAEHPLQLLKDPQHLLPYLKNPAALEGVVFEAADDGFSWTIREKGAR